MERKKVIFVTIAMSGGGTERVISVLANDFINKGIDVTIMMIAGNEVAYELDSAVQIISIGGTSGGSLLQRLKRIGKMRKCFKEQKKCNIVAMGTVSSIFTLIADWGLKNRVIISERNNPNRINGKPYSKKMLFIRDFLYKRADLCAFQTNDVKDYFPEYLRKKSCVIPNPLPQGIPEVNIINREKCIVTAGRLIPEKNHQMLIEAFAKFSREYQDYSLKIFGNGELESELKSLINELNITDKAGIFPFTSNLYAEIMNSSVYVSTSNGEGISNSILEAMAMGIPTIATDCPIGGSKMCIESENDGILIPVGDVEKLYQGLCKIASDAEYAQRLSKGAMNVKVRFSKDKVCKMWEELLK